MERNCSTCNRKYFDAEGMARCNPPEKCTLYNQYEPKEELVVKKKTVVDHHADICDEIKELYAKKNKAYGDSFAKARQDVPCYTLGKLYDKFNRFMNLSLHPENADFETIEDTLLDLANYAIMELAERRTEKNE